MRRLIYITVLLWWAPFAYAQQDAQQNAQQAVQEAELSIEDCLQLERARARKSATYKPGVDVRGKAVPPADLGGDQNRLPLKSKKIIIDFGVDLAERYNLGSGAYSVTAGIATITFDMESGQLELDGKPLTRSDTRSVEAACRMQGE